MLEVPPETYALDAMSLLPALQNYVSRAPLEDFEQSDWITLHVDLMSFVADYLVRKYGAQWAVAEDPRTPRGYRYLIEVTGRDGRTRQIDPLDVVTKEFSNRPIDIIRMVASAELTLRLASEVSQEE